MKRIAMIIDSVGVRGGAERQFAGLASMLSRRGHEVAVYSYYPDEGYKPAIEKAGGTVTILNPEGGRLAKLKAVRKALREFHPDTVITFKDGPNSIACMLKAAGAKWKLIVSDRNTTQKIDKTVKFQYFLYKFADKIVPNSHSQGRIIEKYFPKLSRKVEVVTNFTDTDTFRPAPAGTHSPMRIIVAGRMARQKNIIRFLEAVKQLQSSDVPPFEIKWYGYETDSEYRKECDAKIAELSLGSIFSFESVCNHIQDVYPEFDIFCLPSLFEGFPNVVCEAMACGLPCAVSDVCDNADIVTDGETGLLFDPLNTDDIAAALRKLLLMPREDREEMGRKAREFAVRSLSMESFADKYEKLL